MPGTLARRVRADRPMRNPWPSGSRVTAASVLQFGGGEAGGLQLKGQRHGEAARVGGGDQLFGVWPPFSLSKRVRNE